MNVNKKLINRQMIIKNNKLMLIYKIIQLLIFKLMTNRHKIFANSKLNKNKSQIIKILLKNLIDYKINTRIQIISKKQR